jgi:hypothetical protein
MGLFLLSLDIFPVLHFDVFAYYRKEIGKFEIAELYNHISFRHEIEKD